MKTFQFQDSVLKNCDKRGDSWAHKVRGKVVFVQDCVAGDIVYHKLCYSNFSKPNRNIPKLFCDDEPPNKKAKLLHAETCFLIVAKSSLSEQGPWITVLVLGLQEDTQHLADTQGESG